MCMEIFHKSMSSIVHVSIPPQVKLSVVIAYCRACTYYMTLLTVLFYVLSQGASVAANIWLSKWSNAEDHYASFNKSAPNATFEPTTACDNDHGPEV